MLADFGDLKFLLNENVHDVFDHGTIIYQGDWEYLEAMGSARTIYNKDATESTGPSVRERNLTANAHGWKVIIFPYIPTAENMARWIWERIAQDVGTLGFELFKIEVWETPTSLAVYTERM